MKNVLLGLTLLAGLVAMPALAASEYPVHDNDARYSWTWDVDTTAVVLDKAQTAQTEDEDDANDLGW